MRFGCGCERDETGQRIESCPKPGSEWCNEAQQDGRDLPETYADLGQRIGRLLDQKQQSYGDSFHRCPELLKVLYPNGIPVSQYQNVLTFARIFDKMFRLATGRTDAEDPVKDIAGYALLRCKEAS